MIPGSANPLLLGGDGYQISRSVRLRSSASAFFSRTNSASPTDSRRWTWSGWVKRGTLGAIQTLIGQCNAAADDSYLQFRSDNTLGFGSFSGAGTDYGIITPAVFRDPSAWYHVIAVLDTANATAADRAILYVNGVRQTVNNAPNGTWPQNSTNNKINTASQVVNIGRRPNFGDNPFDGYLTEINFIDGQALTPAAFGETNPITGVWQPKKYTGTYGTNGFYLNFSDNSAATAAAIGKDYSGNGNNWTPNNISLTAGVTYDSMLDVPTPWADGGNGRGNYCTFNPTIAASTGVGVITNGNLQCVTPTGGASNNYGTIGISSGKWYWEITATARTTDAHIMIGINDNTQSATEFYSQSRGYAYRGSGEKWNNGSGVAYGSSAATGDIIGIAFDADSGSLEFFRNGSSMGVAFTGITASTYFPAICDTGTTVTWTATANFGQRPFAYTPPTGFRALNTQNLPEPLISNGRRWFDATTYTGNGSTQSIVNSGGFQPDLVWGKSRSTAIGHGLYDSVRGATKWLGSESTAAETTYQGVTAFNSNGFSVGASSDVNNSGSTFVGWQWRRGAQAGFDIQAVTAQASGNGTFSHSLGVAPKMLIVKSRAAVGNWNVWTPSLTDNQFLLLNTTAAATTDATSWGSTAPTSSSFTLGSKWAGAGSLIAYLFAEVPGFSRFGSYTGNGSADGPFVFCGFRPRWLMIKRTDSTSDWQIMDTSRDINNAAVLALFPNLSNAETSGYNKDLLSNGFKLRDSGASTNASGGTYIFAAFSETAFKYSLAR